MATTTTQTVSCPCCGSSLCCAGKAYADWPATLTLTGTVLAGSDPGCEAGTITGAVCPPSPWTVTLTKQVIAGEVSGDDGCGDAADVPCDVADTDCLYANCLIGYVGADDCGNSYELTIGPDGCGGCVLRIGADVTQPCSSQYLGLNMSALSCSPVHITGTLSVAGPCNIEYDITE